VGDGECVAVDVCACALAKKAINPTRTHTPMKAIPNRIRVLIAEVSTKMIRLRRGERMLEMRPDSSQASSRLPDHPAIKSDSGAILRRMAAVSGNKGNIKATGTPHRLTKSAVFHRSAPEEI